VVLIFASLYSNFLCHRIFLEYPRLEQVYVFCLVLSISELRGPVVGETSSNNTTGILIQPLRILRMCLSLSVTKIFAEGQLFRKLCFAYTGILFILYIISLFILTVSCRSTPCWRLDFYALFYDSTWGTIIMVVRKFLSSYLLYYWPLH